jgi:acyl-CoA thioester hydrolase
MAEPFRHRFRVRYAECDAQSVVFNAHYFAYSTWP